MGRKEEPERSGTSADKMNNGNNFNQFMYAAIQANQHHPAFAQMMQPGAAPPLSDLSPYAPTFTPSVPPPDLPPSNLSQGYNFQGQDFYRNNPPPFMPGQAMQGHTRRSGGRQFGGPGGTEQFPTDYSNGDAQQTGPAQRGGMQFQNSSRQRGRGQGGFRGRGRGGGQFDHFGQRKVQHQQYFSNSAPQRNQQQQQPSHASSRHAKNDYGEFLYSHADMGRKDDHKNSGPSHPPADAENGRGKMYVRKVDQYKKQNGASGSDFAKDDQQDRRGNYRGSGSQNDRSASGQSQGRADFRNRNGSRSAFAGRRNVNINGKLEVEDVDRRVEMEEQLRRGRYECMVCCDNIRQEVAVWNCQTCYHVFHLRCIKQWVKSSMTEGDDDIWRCPACQYTHTKPPSGYRCFCGKARDPKFQPGETPHSCGELCGRKGKQACTHKCTLLCHPGPCPPCNAVVQRTCLCGVERKSMRCDQVSEFRCEKECGKDLNCGKHKCAMVCHEGDCLPCMIPVPQVCYGGHKTREVLCGSDEAELVSFPCQQMCSKKLSCGNHVCEELCHPGECGLCPLLPEQVTRCCCGQTAISQLDTKPRKSCLDPLPTCDKVCSRPMDCGHTDNRHSCPDKCHEGPCGQCEGHTTLTCVCGANQKDFLCRELSKFTADEPFKCERRCNKKRLCGRHKCGELCCTRDVHICEMVCGRTLNCGQHKCEQLCHNGNCRPCLQASFEELSCSCGYEVIYPPIPCGTRPPSCHRICTRSHACDHPVRHTCHSDENCAPCTELVQKWCMGDHEKRKNVPCHMQDISCGRQCGKPLPCVQHKCIKTCHKGPCLLEDQGEPCTQPCRKKRKDCDHACAAPCHPNTEDCPPTSCKAQMEIKCACGNRTAKVQCQAGSNLSAEIAQFQRLTVQAMASGSAGQEVDMTQLTVQKKNTTRQLECDSNCAMLERNKRLALALEIQNPDLDAKLSGPKYSDFLKDSAKKFPQFIAKAEKSFAELVQNAKQSKQPSRSYAFPTMNREQRRVVHEMAEAYGCETQSYDYEPNKNVVATAHRNKCWMPSLTLSASVSRGKGAPPPIPHAKSTPAWGSESKLASALFKEKDKPKEKPEIDYFDFSSK